jgi:predicted DNA-binding transcriptional regulator YafY
MELGEKFRLKVRFWGDSARFVRETHFHPTQEIIDPGDGTIVFTAEVCGIRALMRWVLTFGGEAEVLEPLELRERVVKALRAGVERYG